MIVLEVVGKGDEPFRRTLYADRDDYTTFVFEARGKRLKHVRYPGTITLEDGPGVMLATVRTRKGQEPWQIVSALVGLLVRRFSDEVSSITIRSR